MNTIHDIDLKGDDYRSLIELASRKCDTFAFVVRKDMMADEKLAMKYHNEFVSEIQSSFIERKKQSEWAVTALYDSTAYVFYYELNEQTKLFLQRKSQALFDWISPLPEDLMFYKGEDVWLAGCSHEHFFVVSEEYRDFEDLMESIDRV